MGKVLSDMANGSMPFAINNGFNWVDVRDVAISAVNCLDKGIDGQNYILPGRWASMPELSNMVKHITGNRTPCRNDTVLDVISSVTVFYIEESSNRCQT